jgi:ribosome-interacting GTPase 1
MSHSLDLPGIVEGASAGRGRGRQVVSTAKTSDLIIMMLDATKSVEQRRLLEIELDAVGIRLNKSKPDGELLMHHIAIHLSILQWYSSKKLQAA